MHQRESSILSDHHLPRMLSDAGWSIRGSEPRINRSGTRTWARFRLVLSAVLLVAFLFFFQLSASTRRTNALVQQLYQNVSYAVSNVPTSYLKILIVGLVSSLPEMNERVTKSLVQLCSLYKEAEIHIVFGSSGNNDSLKWWESTDCRTTFVPQMNLLHTTSIVFETMNRFQKIALLRSLQRQQILQRKESHFDVVVNLDFDVTDLPPLDSVMHAIHHAKSRSIVCANGYETWYLPWGKTRLYYDTLASVESDGTWWYRAYAANLWEIITFGQARLFDRILQSQYTYKMKSCFGGLAVYDYNTWSTEECNYTARATDEWKLSTEYTLPSGDACEHVVFQQCLRHALPSLQVGIQPNLVIGRDAALFSTMEAKMGLVKILIFLSILSYGCRHAWRRYNVRKSIKKTLQE